MDEPQNLDDMTDLRKAPQDQLARIVALYRDTYNSEMLIVDSIIQHLNDNDGIGDEAFLEGATVQRALINQHLFAAINAVLRETGTVSQHLN